jgi:hypothetical protein
MRNISKQQGGQDRLRRQDDVYSSFRLLKELSEIINQSVAA